MTPTPLAAPPAAAGVPAWRLQEALVAAERFTVALPLKSQLEAMLDRVRDLLVRIKEVVPNPATVRYRAPLSSP